MGVHVISTSPAFVVRLSDYKVWMKDLVLGEYMDQGDVSLTSTSPTCPGSSLNSTSARDSVMYVWE